MNNNVIVIPILRCHKMSCSMVSNQEDLKTPSEDKLILPKFSTTKSCLSQLSKSLNGESSRKKLPAKVVKTELDYVHFAGKIIK